jgi:hypothetical protein
MRVVKGAALFCLIGTYAASVSAPPAHAPLSPERVEAQPCADEVPRAKAPLIGICPVE